MCVTTFSMLILEQVWTYQPITITVKHSLTKVPYKGSKMRWRNKRFLKNHHSSPLEDNPQLTFHHYNTLGNWSRFDYYSKNIYNQSCSLNHFYKWAWKKVLFCNKTLEIPQKLMEMPQNWCMPDRGEVAFLFPSLNKYQVNEERFCPVSYKAVISVSEVPLACDMRGKGHYLSFWKWYLTSQTSRNH